MISSYIHCNLPPLQVKYLVSVAPSTEPQITRNYFLFREGLCELPEYLLLNGTSVLVKLYSVSDCNYKYIYKHDEMIRASCEKLLRQIKLWGKSQILKFAVR